jgi:microcystin-dependent protein
MSIPLTVLGVTYNYPSPLDSNWGLVLDNWSTAVTNALAPFHNGGTNTLLSTLNFGTTAGIQVLSLTSQDTNPATSGFLRLGNASPGIEWRNFANNANLALTVNASNQLTFNGLPIGATTSLSNGHIFVGNVSNQPTDVPMTGDIGISNSGVTAIQAGVIVDAEISPSASITRSKTAVGTAYRVLANNSSGIMSENAAITANHAVISDANGQLLASPTTATQLSFIDGVTSDVQAQINAISGSTVPVGAMLDFAWIVAPTGWLGCDGSAVSRTTYANLFAVIGTLWGPGDGSTTFNLPDFRRSVAVGSGGSGTAVLGNAVGDMGGSETETLTQAQLPTSLGTANSVVTDPGHNHTEQFSTGGGAALGMQGTTNVQTGVNMPSTNSTTTNTTGITVATTITNASGGNPHNIMQPSAVVLKIIKY